MRAVTWRLFVFVVAHWAAATDVRPGPQAHLSSTTWGTMCRGIPGATRENACSTGSTGARCLAQIRTRISHTSAGLMEDDETSRGKTYEFMGIAPGGSHTGQRQPDGENGYDLTKALSNFTRSLEQTMDKPWGWEVTMEPGYRQYHPVFNDDNGKRVLELHIHNTTLASLTSKKGQSVVSFMRQLRHHIASVEKIPKSSLVIVGIRERYDYKLAWRHGKYNEIGPTRVVITLALSQSAWADGMTLEKLAKGLRDDLSSNGALVTGKFAEELAGATVTIGADPVIGVVSRKDVEQRQWSTVLIVLSVCITSTTVLLCLASIQMNLGHASPALRDIV